MKGLRITFAALGLAICAVAYSYAQQIGTADCWWARDPSRWLTHSGDYTSRRHSPLTQIAPENIGRLTPLWTFETGLGFGRKAKFEATPIAIDGTLVRHRAPQPCVGDQWPHGRAHLALPAEAAADHAYLLRHGQPRVCRVRRWAIDDDARCARDGDRSKDGYPDLGCPDDRLSRWATRRPPRRSSSRTS